MLNKDQYWKKSYTQDSIQNMNVISLVNLVNLLVCSKFEVVIDLDFNSYLHLNIRLVCVLYLQVTLHSVVI